LKIKSKLFAVYTLITLICLIAVPLAFIYNKQPEEFGYIVIDPNKEEQPIFTVTILACEFTSNDSWITRTDFSLSIVAKYNFSEKSLFIELFSYETATREIIPHPNITTHFIEVDIIKENYFLKIRLYEHFGTQFAVRICEKLLNYTIQPLTFYKWGVLNY